METTCHYSSFGVAKMFRVPPHLLSNPEGEIDLLIVLESGQLLLREVYQVNGKDLMKSHFSKDLQLCSSLLTDLLVCKGAVGGQRFGEGNSIYYSDSTPNAHLLKSVSNSGSHYQFFQKPSQEDLNLLPHGVHITNHFPAGVVQSPPSKLFSSGHGTEKTRRL